LASRYFLSLAFATTLTTLTAAGVWSQIGVFGGEVVTVLACWSITGDISSIVGVCAVAKIAYMVVVDVVICVQNLHAIRSWSDEFLSD